MNRITMNRIIKKGKAHALLTFVATVCALMSACAIVENATISYPAAQSTGTLFPASTADPHALAKTRAVYNYLYNLPHGSSSRVISGQFTQDMSDTTGIYSATGKNAGLLGIDYAWEHPSNTEVIAWSDAGGLVTISQHFKNPVTGRGESDLTNVDLVRMITPGTALNSTFNGYLDTLAGNLTTLQSANVVVILRLFHEMNGNWFWWGGKDGTQFINVWKYTFNYLTTTKGLHNLIWNWSSYQTLDKRFYPGARYVDMVGVSVYSQGNTISTVTGIPDSKPFAINEWGYHKGAQTWNPSSYPPANIAPMISSLKTNMPNAVYWLAWNGIYSMNYNTNMSALLADPWVITRDEIPAFGNIHKAAN